MLSWLSWSVKTENSAAVVVRRPVDSPFRAIHAFALGAQISGYTSSGGWGGGPVIHSTLYIVHYTSCNRTAIAWCITCCVKWLSCCSQLFSNRYVLLHWSSTTQEKLCSAVDFKAPQRSLKFSVFLDFATKFAISSLAFDLHTKSEESIDDSRIGYFPG